MEKQVTGEEFKKGPWDPEEDLILIKYVETYGEGKWNSISKRSGLMRGGKSCRMRWKNYLRPNIKHGSMSVDEEDLIIRIHKLVGNRWSLIAGRIPGRTDDEIKNYWNTHLSKKIPKGETMISRTSSKKKKSSCFSKRAESASSENTCNSNGDDEKNQLEKSDDVGNNVPTPCQVDDSMKMKSEMQCDWMSAGDEITYYEQPFSPFFDSFMFNSFRTLNDLSDNLNQRFLL